jgi:hypothetical protein|tara:strand:- start:3775 stop:4071 length:297 start_codon:yes stop_codon:yes gene_type:complete
MKLEVKQNCPMDKFNPCRQFDCAWFMKISGTNPNDGQPTEEWGCAVAWLPVLLIENAQQSRQTGAAVESFRNEMVESNKVSQAIEAIKSGAAKKLIEM